MLKKTSLPHAERNIRAQGAPIVRSPVSVTTAASAHRRTIRRHRRRSRFRDHRVKRPCATLRALVPTGSGPKAGREANNKAKAYWENKP